VKIFDILQQALKGYPVAHITAILAATNSTVLRAERLLQEKGKWSFNTPNGASNSVGLFLI
jgi:hypothetical protein